MDALPRAFAPPPYAVAWRRARRARRARVAGAVTALLVTGTLAACSASDPTIADLPSDVASARPSISAEEAQFVLA
ncbi:MAG: hypothetical protein HOQ18_11165, partial [Dermatophilaceae bacterium]|nr:hypothetical protein [Dermatophilaceae bacterium]